jgi:hypothetical protein
MKILSAICTVLLTTVLFGQPCDEQWKVSPDNAEITTPGNVTFTYTGVSNSGQSLTVNYGDGSLADVFSLTGSPLAPFQHNFASEGIFNVTFELSGTCSQLKSTQIVVSPNCASSLGNYSAFYLCAGEPGTYDISLPTSPPGTLVEVIWNMGDGAFITNTNTNINYIYQDAGFFYRTVAVHYYDSGLDQHCYYLTHYDDGQGGIFTDFNVMVSDVDVSFTMSPINPVPGNSVVFTYTGYQLPNASSLPWFYEFNVDGVSPPAASGASLANGDTIYTYNNIQAGSYCAKLDMMLRDPTGSWCPSDNEICFNVSSTQCDTCNSFKPKAGERYWMSAWVKVNEGQVKTYNAMNIDNTLNPTAIELMLMQDPFIFLDFVGGSSTIAIHPSGNIIDGWQRIVGEFTIPAGTYDLSLTLNADNNQETYFDDIRIHPFNSSIKSYVYDGETFWLTSELDDNNYATFYEYDEEGGLIRIKKETERGVVTIQETRSSTTKKDNP